ncbi:MULTISPECIES: hypothetical protein [unclassified Bradyrhizobium]|uniref:hypothetical protein n=1 Tax=unclassified Bradyrhizobium TaxID=2631580 RepID=UPI00247A6EEC|nr:MULTISPECIES: hypothetical protein [unclassified Bradyrhizobium]WGR67745.1 hypothetical protein MTX24_19945 [Bradyrhizobium sp. ISRA426]WGR79797.1 hypothetical protein MTX21_05060 [Bradyrhizobium sp. ISRA430]WGR90133.1 hypothetical protein MTX25_19625 [Bradyrhizobium sp. ISRA432]
MPLHRDIFWVGRQWAVTGFGIQAVDQRLRGVLDIAIARLWDDDLIQNRRTKPGVNVEDFDKALTVARGRFPQAQAAAPIVAQLDGLDVAQLDALDRIDASPAANPVMPAMKLRAEGRLARFLPQWRIRR